MALPMKANSTIRDALSYLSTKIIPTYLVSLILAEAALSQGDDAGFMTQINALRALDSKLSAYSGQVDAMTLLKHSRRVNLFLQGRRIADHYRFEESATDWQSSTDAVVNPGTFFPITITEIRANPFIN